MKPIIILVNPLKVLVIRNCVACLTYIPSPTEDSPDCSAAMREKQKESDGHSKSFE